MKKLTLTIFLIGLLLMLTVVACATVGATDAKNSNNDKNNAETISKESETADNITVGNKQDEEKDNKENVKEETETKSDQAEAEEVKQEVKEEVKKEEPASSDAKVYYSGDGSKKLVALTFDDGPETKHTPEILDILDDYNIKATFFVIGQNAEKNSEMLKEIHNRGHQIGSHSWSHKYLPKISKEAKKDEILKVERLLTDILGEYTPIFRPPYGAVKDQDKELLASLGYKTVNWSVDTRDWEGVPNEQMMKYVKEQLKPGGIILMHNTSNTKTVPNLINTLPTMIDWILEQGYEFATVTEILN